MELDELKKSWDTLNTHLPKQSITDEKQIAKLIARYKGNTRKSLRSLLGFQLFSLLAGGGCIMIGLLVAYIISRHIESDVMRTKTYILLAYFTLTWIIGIWWDYKTYRWIRETRIDEMPVAQVSRRMVTFRQGIRYEIRVICIWLILFNILYYWIIGGLQYGIRFSLFSITLMTCAEFIVICLIYKKMIYKHLNNIKKNMEELEDICTE